MRSTVLRSTAILIAALTAGSCRDFEPEPSLAPPDYSPQFTKVAVVRDDGREKHVLVPEACLSPGDQSPADYGPERLPPGCANNYNLQKMAARKRDLVKGRPLGPAPAAPAARAAQQYIDGRHDTTLGGGVRPDQPDIPQTGPSTTSTQ